MANIPYILTEQSLTVVLNGKSMTMESTNPKFEDAVALLESLRSKVSAYTHQVDDKTVLTSVRIGIAEYQETDSMDSLLSRADSALYSVKSKGRNSLVIG